MKRSILLVITATIFLIGGAAIIAPQSVSAIAYLPQIQSTPVGPSVAGPEETQTVGAVHAFYFYANDCPHCLKVLEEFLKPLQEKHGDLLDLRLLEISIPEYYEALMTVESFFNIPSVQRSIPTLVIDNEILIGETEITETFSNLIDEGLVEGGIPFPEIPEIDPEKLISVEPEIGVEPDDDCGTDEICVVDLPIYIGYFYQTGCKECSRVEADLNYLRTKYPQMQIAEYNIYDHADLAAWMTARIDPELAFQSPALFIGDQYLFGSDIFPENVIPILEQYKATGTEPVWETYNPEEGQRTIIERFKNMGWLAVVTAGLIDGINPCAFATLIFFVSYLTLSGKTRKEVLLVGGGFTLGVFLAYFAIGLGLYQVLELVSDTLKIVARVVYILTGIFCLILAVLSFLDYRKARQGEVSEMMLKLPEPLRKRINATIRRGRNARSYVLGAFVAGLFISFLELACTGQVYLPTIIFVSSIPGLKLRAIFYLLIYNLLFVFPLTVIFILVYYGTTSKDLTHFLQKKAAAIKFGMAVVFVALGGWLLISLGV